MTSAEDIKSRLDIVDVLREYITLKPAGANFQALCPFHNEKSPSFLVSSEKQIWHCFGCGKGGDVIKFIMEKEGLPFVEALRFLAPKAGIVLKQESPKQSSLKTRVLDCLEAAATFYNRMVESGSGSAGAREYLEGRGLDEATINEWQIGFAPDSWDDLILFLKAKGFNEREIDTAGLASKGTTGGRFYNRFRNRIMFPIRDVAGQTVAFTGRVMPGSDDKLGKYINSPSTIVYDKSRILFGLDKAKQAIRNAGEAIIVEGQMDCITAHQFGFKNVVASSGTALTEHQGALLGRYTSVIALALDADSAGQAAAERAGEIIGDSDQKFIEAQDRYGRLKLFIDPSKNYQKNIKVIKVPFGKDPDEAIRQSAEAWEQAVKEAMSLPAFLFDRIMAPLNLSKVEDKKIAVNKFLPIISRLESSIDQDFWLKKLSLAVNVESSFLQEALKKGAKKPLRPDAQPNRQPEERVETARINREILLSERLLALLTKFNNYIAYIVDYIAPEQLFGFLNQSLYSNLIIYYNESKQNRDDRLEVFALDYNKFRIWLLEHQAEPQAEVLDKLAILAEKEFLAYDAGRADAEIKLLVKELKTVFLNNRRKEISRLIMEMDKVAGNEIDGESLMRELAILNDELRRLLTP